jgi:hypothetical protein
MRRLNPVKHIEIQQRIGVKCGHRFEVLQRKNRHMKRRSESLSVTANYNNLSEI